MWELSIASITFFKEKLNEEMDSNPWEISLIWLSLDQLIILKNWSNIAFKICLYS